MGFATGSCYILLRVARGKGLSTMYITWKDTCQEILLKYMKQCDIYLLEKKIAIFKQHQLNSRKLAPLSNSFVQALSYTYMYPFSFLSISFYIFPQCAFMGIIFTSKSWNKKIGYPAHLIVKDHFYLLTSFYHWKMTSMYFFFSTKSPLNRTLESRG